MASISVQDQFGVQRLIHSSNPELLAQWLWEHVAPLANSNWAYPPIQIRFLPDCDRNGVPDFPINDPGGYFNPISNLDQFIAELEKLRDGA